MITQRKADTSRGQVGIGTLIVFIALVLVAAIAAGVLINTAGFLQTQAETTGQESTSQVSDNIQDLGAVGTVGTSSLDTDGETVDTVTELRIKVSSSPGSDNIDLNESTIEYIGPGGSTTLVNGTFNSGQRDASTDRSSGALDSGKFGIRQIKSAADNTDPAREFVILDQSDRYELVINLDAFDNSATGTTSDNKLTDLREGEQATITITTAQGSQRVVEINVPDTLADKDSGDTVRV